MPIFRIRVTNTEFETCDDVDVPSAQIARSKALKGALEIGAEEVGGGKLFFGAEVSVENGDGTRERLMVAIGASPLR